MNRPVNPYQFGACGPCPLWNPGIGAVGEWPEKGQVQTRRIGGISGREAQQLLRGLLGLNLIGGDVVEVAPPVDPSRNTALVGATMMYEILCLLAEAVRRRG